MAVPLDRRLPGSDVEALAGPDLLDGVADDPSELADSDHCCCPTSASQTDRFREAEHSDTMLSRALSAVTKLLIGEMRKYRCPPTAVPAR